MQVVVEPVERLEVDYWLESLQLCYLCQQDEIAVEPWTRILGQGYDYPFSDHHRILVTSASHLDCPHEGVKREHKYLTAEANREKPWRP